MTKYLTPQEVADVFRKSVRTIYRWINEKDPIKNFVRVKDGVLIPQEEVDRILSEGHNGDIADIIKPRIKNRPDGGFVNRWRK